MKTVILAATDEEYDALYNLKFDGSIIVLQMGIGLTNAAISTYEAIQKYTPRNIVVAGLAGAIDPKLAIGDLILAQSILQHDSFQSADNDKPFYIRPGISSLNRADHLDPTIGCNNELTNKILTLISSKHNIFSGTIASGSEFMCSTERKLELYKTKYNILALDMESVSVVQVATKFNVPVACLRVISDVVNTKDKETILKNYIDNLDYSLISLKNAVSCLREGL